MSESQHSGAQRCVLSLSVWLALAAFAKTRTAATPAPKKTTTPAKVPVPKPSATPAPQSKFGGLPKGGPDKPGQRIIPVEPPMDPADYPVQFGKEAGRPLYIDFGADRVATLVQSSFLKTTRVPFQITDSTCREIAETDNFGCTLELPLYVQSYALVWRENPNPDLIGHTIRFSPPTKGMKEEYYQLNQMAESRSTVLTRYSQRYTEPTTAAFVPPAQILCKSFAWLPGGSDRGAPESAAILSWMRELVVSNPEDSSRAANELALAAGAMNVLLKRDQQGGMGIEKIATFIGDDRYSRGENSKVLFAEREEKVSLVVKTDGGQVCQITLAHHQFVQPQVTLKEIEDKERAFIYPSPGDVGKNSEALSFLSLMENGFGGVKTHPGTLYKRTGP